ncbi:MAG: serine/threonine-protein phosphatase [Leptospira sp.]|nr:serine/threonine-protein phosphatase [Leptospira sp.]
MLQTPYKFRIANLVRLSFTFGTISFFYFFYELPFFINVLLVGHAFISMAWLFFVESSSVNNRFMSSVWRGIIPIVFDLVAISSVVLITGGTESPFVSSYFIINGIASINENKFFGLISLFLSLVFFLIQGLILYYFFGDWYNIFTGRVTLIKLDVLLITLFWLGMGLFANHLIISNFVFRSIQENRKVTELKNHAENLLSEIEAELNMAGKILNQLQPNENFFWNDLEFGMWFEPHSKVGGDIVGFYPVESYKLRCYIADVTGHGIKSALMTMLIRAELSQFIYKVSELNVLMENFNKIFYDKYRHLNYFCTLSVVEIDLKYKTLKYCSAGHPSQFFYQNGKLNSLYTQGNLLGLTNSSKYNTLKYNLEDTFTLYMFTDGVFEEFSENESIFGEEKLEEFIGNKHELSPMEICCSLKEKIKDFTGNKKYTDDISFLVIKKYGSGDR